MKYFTSALPGKASRKLFVSFFSPSFVLMGIYSMQPGGRGLLRSTCAQHYDCLAL